MNYLTTKAVLDQVFSRIKDNSTALRVKMLAWLNSVMQDVINERAWVFLEKSASLTLVDNSVDLPADFGRETFLKNGIYVFTVSDRLSSEQAALVDSAGGEPFGYTLDTTSLTVHPSADGTLELHYVASFPAAWYSDGVDPTLFPIEFMPLFERYLLTCFYEYDVDESRWGSAAALDRRQLRTLKVLDNQRRPLPQLSSKGFVR